MTNTDCFLCPEITLPGSMVRGQRVIHEQLAMRQAPTAKCGRKETLHIRYIEMEMAQADF